MSKMWVNYFSVSMALVGALILTTPKGYSIGFYLITLVGFGLWFKSREPILRADIQFFVAPILCFSLVQLAMSLIDNMSVRDLGTYLPFVLSFFGLWAIRKYKPNEEYFWFGLVAGAVFAAGIAVYQAVFLNMRAVGFTHPIQFGNIALLVGMLCFIKALMARNFDVTTVLLWVGTACGLIASVLSQTRGGWVAIVLVFTWILVQTTKGWSVKKKLVLISSFFGVLLLIVLLPESIVTDRVYEAVDELMAFFQSGRQDTSVGSRLAMWSVAWDAFQQSPWFGIGKSGWLLARDMAVSDGRLSAFSADFTHVHNEYLDMATKHGLFGLSSYLFLMLGPMLLFFGPYKQHPNPQVRTLAIAGMVVPMMYLDFGLTQVFLSHNSGRVVLSALWMCLAALMLNALEEDRHQHNK